MENASSLALIAQHPLLNEAAALNSVKMLSNIILALRQEVLLSGVDYGVIPGTGDKPTLLLPGMEKITRALNAVPKYTEVHIVRDYDRPLFHFEYECQLLDAFTGIPIPGGVGRGLCHSMESSFAWRWVTEDKVPSRLNKADLETRTSSLSEPVFAVDKAETTGQYGKPAAYWQQFKEAIANGTARKGKRATKSGKEMDVWEIGGVLYRIPNPDVFDQENAIMKRAKKRAWGDAVKGAANVSEFFTVDLEDFARYDDVETITIGLAETTATDAMAGGKVPDAAGMVAAAQTLATQPPTEAPKPQSEPVKLPTWLTGEDADKNRKLVIAKIMQSLNLAPESVDAELKLLIDMDDPKALESWAKYPTGKEAIQAVLDANTKRAQLMQPAQPKKGGKSKPADIPAGSTPFNAEKHVPLMDSFCMGWWDNELDAILPPSVVLAAIGKIGWSEFKTLEDAMEALKQYCIGRKLPIIVEKVLYYGKQKPMILTNGQFGVSHRTRQDFRDLGFTDVETWTAGEYLLPEKVIVEYELHTPEKGDSYWQVIADGISLLSSINF